MCIISTIKMPSAIHPFFCLSSCSRSASVTFFATPDWALTHHGHHGHCSDLSTFDHMKEEDVAAFAVSHRCHWDDVMTAAEDLHGPGLLDDKKERRKKILKLLIHAILAYECMPEALSIYSLGITATYSSKLAIPGIRGGERLRIRLEQNIFPPSTSINFYSKIVESDIQTSNGKLLAFGLHIWRLICIVRNCSHRESSYTSSCIGVSDSVPFSSILLYRCAC